MKPISFSEQKPTEADANAAGCILVWNERVNFWIAVSVRDTLENSYSHWLPQPEPPQSLEDEAFKESQNNIHFMHIRRTRDRKMFDAGIAFARKEKA